MSSHSMGAFSIKLSTLYGVYFLFLTEPALLKLHIHIFTFKLLPYLKHLTTHISYRFHWVRTVLKMFVCSSSTVVDKQTHKKKKEKEMNTIREVIGPQAKLIPLTNHNKALCFFPFCVTSCRAYVTEGKRGEKKSYFRVSQRI